MQGAETDLGSDTWCGRNGWIGLYKRGQTKVERLWSVSGREVMKAGILETMEICSEAAVVSAMTKEFRAVGNSSELTGSARWAADRRR
ncbi:HupH hydrogenase expression protein [Gracilaria domingensis]|nr:HupH hydrogenase expression protein [Gracilaria domingensis]